MENIYLFPFADYLWLYAAFIIFVCGMLLLDLGVFHKNPHEVSTKEAMTWTIVWVSLAILFNVALWQYSLWKFPQDIRLNSLPGFDGQQLANQVGIEFLTGFVIEKALAIENIFAFFLVFQLLAIPQKYQHRVLFYGILGALFFRAIFVALGAQLMQISWIVYVFGAFLIITGIKVIVTAQNEPDIADSAVVKWLTKHLPVTPTHHEQKFWVRINGRLLVTPMMVALLLIEISDVIFAVDSVPAIFAITKEPLIVFTSNIFAILGLRSMFFIISNVVQKFHLIKYGLGAVLIFVGLKLAVLNEYFGGKFPVTWSLGIIVGLIAVSMLASILMPKRRE